MSTLVKKKNSQKTEALSDKVCKLFHGSRQNHFELTLEVLSVKSGLTLLVRCIQAIDIGENWYDLNSFSLDQLLRLCCNLGILYA